MPLYIPWLTDTIKKRGVRYLLHHYLGQFFEEKLTLEQLSIDIYEGKGSIRNLALDVDGLNDELDFVPFTFLDGCSIEQISVEVPWSSLVTDACRVELDGAKFFCRLKTTADAAKHHCTESTLLSRSLMTSSMQMAEEIVTTEDDEDIDYHHASSSAGKVRDLTSKKKDANQMFEGLEMFALLIDSVLRRTKLTARNTLFQIQPYDDKEIEQVDEDTDRCDDTMSRNNRNQASSRSSGDEFSEPTANSDTDDESDHVTGSDKNQAKSTVEFFISFFRCEEMIDQSRADSDIAPSKGQSSDENDVLNKSPCAIPETVTKLLTLEDVEMRIDGVPVSNLIGKHTITIKFNGQKSEISIFSGSPLLAVISHKQLETFFNVFDSSKSQDADECSIAERNQKPMRPEDYAKIENQLLESASVRNIVPNESSRISTGALGASGDILPNTCPYYATTQGVGSIGTGRRWPQDHGRAYAQGQSKRDSEYGSQSSSFTIGPTETDVPQASTDVLEPTLDHIEAFSCELKLPGIWLCIIRAGEPLPPLIKPYADSINSFHTINKYIDNYIKVPHIRCLALKVALDITAAGTNIFLADLDVSEHLVDSSRMSPILKLVHSDQTNTPMSSSRYKASISKGKDITIDLLTRTRVMFDPTIIDRIVYDYKLVKLNSTQEPAPVKRDNRTSSQSTLKRAHSPDLNLTLKGERFKVELLCPIPDLTPNAHARQTQLRPQSFIFDFRGMVLSWQSDKLTISSSELLAYVKTQPMQGDNEAVKFVESTSRGSDKITLILEPSPSDLDNAFSNDVEQALNESSMYDSIYVSQATESRLPTNPFQTKRKLVRASFQSQQSATNKPYGAQLTECDHEKILTPGDRQHLLDYLNQTMMATKLSLNLHLPVCRIEFEDKEQLDLIYNRFGNDFVFWQPRVLTKVPNVQTKPPGDDIHFRQTRKLDEDDDEKAGQEEDDDDDDRNSNLSGQHDSQNSFHSVHNLDTSPSERYDNEATCKIIVDELYVNFNHQSCASALKQELCAENFLLGVIIDVNKQPNTLLSFVADNLELSTDLETVLQKNFFTDKNSVFALTAEIKRPTKLLKDIKLAIQLNNGLFHDFRSENYTRFWQSINVTDEPILGYVAPQIVTELHIDILNTSLMLVREDTRPALLSIDELYMTSMVMEKTSQVMIRLIADEVSLYMKRDRQGSEIMKNYICLIDSGLIDLDVKFGQAGRLEFGVINNVITVRVCQDSLNALCKLFNVLIRSSSQKNVSPAVASAAMEVGRQLETMETGQQRRVVRRRPARPTSKTSDKTRKAGTRTASSNSSESKKVRREREMNLLADAMNDYSIKSSPGAEVKTGRGAKEVDSCTGSKANQHSSCDEGEDENGQDYVGDKNSHDEDDDEHDGKEHDDEKDRGDYDEGVSDAPPVFQRTTLRASSPGAQESQRDPNACLLDESNPLLGDMFSQPLMPSSSEKLNNPASGADSSLINSSESTNHGGSQAAAGGQMNLRPMDESGFFVIGDDDVGAGIIDKKQHEPVVRKLIDGPINIIDNHFKMTKPRTIPEILATSIERYVLEEMTLVVNLYGGHDFDDEDTPTAANDDTASSKDDTADQAAEATNELLDTISAESQLIRSRTGSMSNMRHSGSLKRPGRLPSAVGRRKHLSEGGGESALKMGAATQRVRFGEGAVNLWESLDLMSSPDFLGARPRPSQPPLNSDSKQAGGTWRESDVCIQLTLSKVKLLYEVADGTIRPAPAQGPNANGAGGGATAGTKVAQGRADEPNLTPPISSRFMLFIQDIEVKDRIAASDINKMLYEYCTESMPKRSAQMLAIKNIATINPSDGCEECDLRVSLKPLRLNIDQDTLLFLIEFCTTFCKVLTKHQQQEAAQQSQSCGPAARSSVGASSQLAGATLAASPANPSKQVDGASCASGNARLHERGTGVPWPDAKRGHSATLEQGRAPHSQSCSSSGGSSTASSLSTPHMTRSSADKRRQPVNAEPTATSASRDGAVCAAGNFNRSGRSVCENDTATGAGPVSSAASSRNCVDGLASASNNGGPHQHQALEHSHSSDSDEDYWESGDEMDDDEARTAARRAESSVDEESDEHEAECEDDELASSGDNNSGGAKTGTSGRKRPLPTHCHANDLSGAPNQQPIYIKSFTFSPDVPIRIDYHAKHLDFEQGALAGILMGLAHLDHSELILRRVQAKHGMRGLDRVLLFAINSWLSDIKRNQLPSILGGVGPMHSVIQLFQGMRDLVWMPIDHYRKDGRLVRGLQRGASSFSSSTAMAAINLVNRFISIVQCTAQIAHDIVTPPSMLPAHSARRLRAASGARSSSEAAATTGASSRRARHRRHARHLSGQEGGLIGHGASAGSAALPGAGAGLNQPRNFCEGVAVGFNIIKEGFNDTARNVTVGMQAEDMRSAVGELVRQIPSTLLNPIISATEGAQSVLVGIRNQIAPDARRDDQEKWKGRVRGK